MIDQEGITSLELEKGAPNITYSGNEGPSSPQQEIIKAGIPEDLTMEMAFEVFMKSEGRAPRDIPELLEFFKNRPLSEGPPLPNDPTEPVNPFGPKPIGPVIPNREMAAFGGIMGLDQRRQYGLGSKFKKMLNKVTSPFTKVAKKLMPKELAPYARMASPFVGGPLGTLLYAAGTAKQKGKFNIGDLAAMAAPYAAKRFSYTPGQGIRSVGFNQADAAREGAMGFGETFRSKVPYGEKIANTLFGDPSGQYMDLTGDKAALGDASGFFGVDGKILDLTNSSAGGILDTKLGAMAFGTPGKKEILTSKLKLGSWGVGIVSGIQAGKYADEMAAAQAAEDALRAEDDAATQAEVDAARAWAIETFGSMNVYAEGMATGGRINKNMGGEMDMGGISSLQTQQSDVTPQGMELDLRGGGFIPIGKAEKADDVPARVSKNEFVFTADAVKAAGGGSVNEGAKRMYDTMKRLESQVG